MVDALCSTPIGNDTVALMNLNKLFVELKNNLISMEHLNKINMNHSLQKTPSYSGRNTIPRSNTAPSLRLNKKRKNITDFDFLQKQTNNAGEHSSSGEDVVVRLNSLMGDLESSFSSLLKSSDIVGGDVHLTHDVNNNNNDNHVLNDEDSDDIFQPSPADRYVLDNFTQYLYRKYLLRSKAYAATTTCTKPIKPPRRMSDSRLNDYQHRYWHARNSSSSSDSGYSTSGSGMLYNISHHHTLCRRLKTLEASFGSTLKKQLHSVILKRMREMNVAGCVYCLYALYVS